MIWSYAAIERGLADFVDYLTNLGDYTNVVVASSEKGLRTLCSTGRHSAILHSSPVFVVLCVLQWVSGERSGTQSVSESLFRFSPGLVLCGTGRKCVCWRTLTVVLLR